MPDSKVDRAVYLRISKFIQDVCADDAQLRAAVGDKGRDVKWLNGDQINQGISCFETQAPVLVIEKSRLRLYPDLCQQRGDFLCQSPLR